MTSEDEGFDARFPGLVATDPHDSSVFLSELRAVAESLQRELDDATRAGSHG